MGAKSIYQNKYAPSIYSRIIWFLVACNSLLSVVALRNDFSVILLAALSLLGNILILTLSLRKSKRTFGSTEILSSVLLIISLFLWIFTRLPLLNLTISLIIFLIGGIPTYKKVIKNPKDEDLFFWLFFALASLLTLTITGRTGISGYLYPLFFSIFDGGMTILCLRRYIKKHVA
jgi:hypothetical protein